MKAISLGIVIDGIRAKKDRSLGLSISTPEMTVAEKTLMFELQGVNCHATIQPLDEEFPIIEEVKAETDRKTSSSRLRGILWVLWDKRGREGDFDVFYRTQMEKFIQRIKDLVDEESL